MATRQLTVDSLAVLSRPGEPALGRWLFRMGFYPVVVLLATIAHLTFARGLAPAHLSLVTGAVSLASLGLFLACEHLMPHRAAWNQSRGDLLADTLQTNLILPLIARLNETMLAMAFAWLATQIHWTGFFPAHAPFAMQVVLALLVAELAYYWTHRLGHTVSGLWRFHAVHHGASRVYSLNAGRFHPVDAWLGTLAYLGPLLLLGVPAPVVALIATLNAVTGFMEHVNVDFEAGLLNRIFNTAQLHRWHHAADVAQAHCNYGKVLSVWDQVFGTYTLPSDPVGAVGLGPDETPVPPSILAQALYPWRRRA